MPKCKILLLEAGIVALDERLQVVQSLKFDPAGMVDSYRAVKEGGAPSSLLDMLAALKSKGYTEAVVNDGALAGILKQEGFEVAPVGSEEQVALQEQKTKIMMDAGFAYSEAEALELLRKFAIDLSSLRIGEVSARRDLHVSQAVNALDEVDQVINLMGARLREWYGLHFPELDALLQSLPAYAEVVGIGSRDDITFESLKRAGLDAKADAILEAAERSRGGAVTLENIRAMQRLAEEIRHLNSIRDGLTKHLEEEVESVAPNVKSILGATIGARMMARVGGLERLAMLPSSTIQVIGAEKALFRALKTGTRPPKHGIIFQHQLVHSAPRWQRGKIARAIASRVAVAARVDAYRGMKDESIVAKMNARIEEIRTKYEEPTHAEEEEREERFERPRERFGERPARRFEERRFGERRFGERRPQRFGERRTGERKFGERKFGEGGFGERPARRFGERRFGERKFGERRVGEGGFGERKFGERRFGGKKKRGDQRPQGRWKGRKKRFGRRRE